MARIFVSYRREDGIAQTGRIYDRLVTTFGEEDVFMDLGKISAGVDFTAVLDEKLASCELFVAVIGPRWLISRKGRRRLDDAEDFVRREIATALARGVRVIPVLIGDARMPSAADLPAELAELTRRNAVKIRDERFDADMDSLILDIEEPDRPPEDTLLKRLQDARARMRERRNSVLIGTAIVIASALASWSDFFDLFALDTRLSTMILAISHIYDQPPPSDRVAIVGIDGRTEAAVGRPFDRTWREQHARVLDQLMVAQVSVVAFDMFFEEPSLHDADFLAALRRARSAGIRVYAGSHGVAHTADAVSELHQLLAGTGTLCIGKRLGYATTAPLMVARRDDVGEWGTRRFGLGLQAALQPSPATVPDRTERALLVPTRDSVRELDIGAVEVIKSPQSGCTAVHAGEESADLFVRLSDVMYWRSAPRFVKYESLLGDSSSGTPSPAAESLRGKIVLVGLTGGGGMADQHVVMRGGAPETRHGVELQADVVSNLLEARQLHPLHWGGQLLLTILTVAMAALVRLLVGERQRALRWSVVAFSVLLYFWFAGYLCARHLLMLNSVYHLFGFAVAYWLLGKMKISRRQPRELAGGMRT